MANRKKQDMTAELAEGKILPLVFKLTIPAVIAQLITFLYNIVDRMYVARIEGSGMDALAALGIVLPITLIMQAFANLVGLGGAPRAGIKLGEGKPDEANRIFHTAFCLLVLLGIVIGAAAFCFARQIVLLFGCPESAVEFAVSYLKIYACGTIFVMLAQGLNPFILTQGYSWLAMSSVLMGALINIALDPLFIFTFGMGVQGSSLATPSQYTRVWRLNFPPFRQYYLTQSKSLRRTLSFPALFSVPAADSSVNSTTPFFVLCAALYFSFFMKSTRLSEPPLVFPEPLLSDTRYCFL